MEFKSMIRLLPMLFATLLMVACGGSNTKKNNSAVVEAMAVVPIFDADSAYSFVEKQVSFGPRVPNTQAHRNCGDWLEAKLREYGAEVVDQNIELMAYNGTKLQARNIIAQFRPENKKRVLLCAHWDSRPWADCDSDAANHRKPILGANDGGSGVGVLLEIARQMSAVPATVGVDIVLFDAEDYGTHKADHSVRHNMDNSWALGSQYWARIPHKSPYNARYGILLDMVGAPHSTFYREGVSQHYAASIIDKVWKVAADNGYASYFINEEGGFVTDDHLYVNEYMGIPCIDIINHDKESENGFGPYWHTVKDDMSWIDAATLKAVGQTVLAVIYNEK